MVLVPFGKVILNVTLLIPVLSVTLAPISMVAEKLKTDPDAGVMPVTLGAVMSDSAAWNVVNLETLKMKVPPV